jgi:Flp pilus assembly protein TadD
MLKGPLELYMTLGNAYTIQHQYQYAVDVFGHACASKPCSAAWLGAGIACLRLSRLADAELALAEANILDCQNPRIWAHLALVHLLVENHDEAMMVR